MAAWNDHHENYADVTQVGVHSCRYCMPYENDLGTLLVARQRRVPIAQAWGQAKHFEKGSWLGHGWAHAGVERGHSNAAKHLEPP